MHNGSFISFSIIPNYFVSLSWFDWSDIIKLLLFIGTAWITGVMDYYYCEKCDSEFKDETFYTLTNLTPANYVNERSVDKFEGIEKWSQKEIVNGKHEMSIIKNRLHICPKCGDMILTAKCCEIKQNDKGKYSIKEISTIIDGCFI